MVDESIKDGKINKLIDYVWQNPDKINGYIEVYKQICPIECRATLYCMFDDLIEILESKLNSRLYVPRD